MSLILLSYISVKTKIYKIALPSTPSLMLWSPIGTGDRIRTCIHQLLFNVCIRLWRYTHIFVEVSGFEPELGEPKSPVLPLHHTSIFCGERWDRTTSSFIRTHNLAGCRYHRLASFSILCLERDSNSYRPCGPRDFPTTPAFTQANFISVLCFLLSPRRVRLYELFSFACYN